MAKILWVALLLSGNLEPPTLYAVFGTKVECLSYLEEIGKEIHIHKNGYDHADHQQFCLPIMATPSVLKMLKE